MQGYNNKIGSLLCGNTADLRSVIGTPQPDNRRCGYITCFAQDKFSIGHIVWKFLCRCSVPPPCAGFLTKKARVFFIVAIAIGCILFSFFQTATAICGITSWHVKQKTCVWKNKTACKDFYTDLYRDLL